jgi:hypothetical protein
MICSCGYNWAAGVYGQWLEDWPCPNCKTLEKPQPSLEISECSKHGKRWNVECDECESKCPESERGPLKLICMHT